jgi:hypothetical protein
MPIGLMIPTIRFIAARNALASPGNYPISSGLALSMIDASIETAPVYGDYAIESRLFLTERGKLPEHRQQLLQ